jgi:hypothetical protein
MLQYPSIICGSRFAGIQSKNGVDDDPGYDGSNKGNIWEAN